MDISVVVCAHNEERHLGEQLEALLRQKTDRAFEVVVVDNRSTDGTAELVRQASSQDPRLRLVSALDRADKSYAMNVGVREARADAIAFCDADDIVLQGWLNAIANGLDRHQVVTGPHELDRLNPPWLAGMRGRSIETQSVGSFAGIFPTIRGASWGIRREVWVELGGMSEHVHPVEDIDFSFRCWTRDVPITGIDEAAIHYRYRSSLRALWRQGYAYGTHRPLIARLVKESGRGRVPPFSGWKSWAMLIALAPRVVTRAGRARWVWTAANRWGQVVGSVRERTPML